MAMGRTMPPLPFVPMPAASTSYHFLGYCLSLNCEKGIFFQARFSTNTLSLLLPSNTPFDYPVPEAILFLT